MLNMKSHMRKDILFILTFLCALTSLIFLYLITVFANLFLNSRA